MSPQLSVTLTSLAYEVFSETLFHLVLYSILTVFRMHLLNSYILYKYKLMIGRVCLSALDRS